MFSAGFLSEARKSWPERHRCRACISVFSYLHVLARGPLDDGLQLRQLCGGEPGTRLPTKHGVQPGQPMGIQLSSGIATPTIVHRYRGRMAATATLKRVVTGQHTCRCIKMWAAAPPKPYGEGGIRSRSSGSRLTGPAVLRKKFIRMIRW
jgi:hypothetical protein